MIFQRKKKVTLQKMASDIWGAFVQIMQHEFDEANKHDREAFIDEHGWEYDKKRFTEESSFLFIFLIYNEVENHFPEKKVEILKEFTKILDENDMGFLLEPLKDYSIAWHNALARVKRIEFNRKQICLYEDSYRQVDQTEWAKAA